jgi:hypothetical protein
MTYANIALRLHHAATSYRMVGQRNTRQPRSACNLERVGYDGLPGARSPLRGQMGNAAEPKARL